MGNKSVFDDSVNCENLTFMLSSLSLWKRNCLADEEIIGLVRDIFPDCENSEDSVRLEGLICMVRSLRLWQRGGLTDDELLKLSGDVFGN